MKSTNAYIAVNGNSFHSFYTQIYKAKSIVRGMIESLILISKVYKSNGSVNVMEFSHDYLIFINWTILIFLSLSTMKLR